MKLIKCANGHFYDEERYDSCPHCVSAGRNDNVTVPLVRQSANDAVTVAMNATEVSSSAVSAGAALKPLGSLQDAVKAASAGNVNSVDTGDKTVGFFSSTIGKEPVVGWLVALSGEHFGEDFKLKSGRNFIGRSPSMDVAISKDSTVSRERHAMLVYEPRGNMFILQPGDSKELCYLNDEVVLTPKEIAANDRLLVGKTELLFIPCCTKVFNWDMVSNKKD